jgi:hypothetical protein
MTAVDEQILGVACSFCLKPTEEVASMVAGPGVFICDTCVSACVQIIAGQPREPGSADIWDRQLADEDLLAHLPKVAVTAAQVDQQLKSWVGKARARGITWTRIGAALGMTRQSAWERFSGEE